MELWNHIKNSLLLHPSQRMSEHTAEMNFEELVVFAESFSKRLEGETCCAILCRSEMAAAMALLSCFAADITAVPLSMRYGEAHCRKILEFISPSCMITDTYGELMAVHYGKYSYEAPKAHPAVIMCTSGTTGVPKGAMLSEWSIVANVRAISAYFGIGDKDRILIARPLYHCAVLTGEFLTAIEKGSGIEFYSEAFNPSEIFKVIRDKKITVFCATPTLLDTMSRFMRKGQTSTLKHIAVSGECMNAAVGKRIASAFRGADIYHVYGLTEACPRVSYLHPSLFADYGSFVGKPLNGISIRICDESGKPVEGNKTGLLWIKGENVMLGYYKNPKQTAKVLRNGWLCTGDLAEISDNGLLRIKGRNDDLIIRAGMNIYPQEIEAALLSDARVREAIAFGFEHPRLGTQIGLKLVGDFASAAEAKDLCRALLPPYQIPSKIELADQLEKNGSGKLIRRRTRK